jgi:hypothetical protein
MLAFRRNRNSLPVEVTKLYGPFDGGGAMPWYKVVKIDPKGRGLLFNGIEFSRHQFRTKADPVEAEEEQKYIERLKQEEAAESAERDKRKGE